jgi:cobaltochelatase CobS
VLLPEPHKTALTPTTNKGYRFQPFLSHVIDAINSREHVLLTGGTGVGKTTHIMQLAARLNKPVLRANFNGETRLSDFIGKMSVIDGRTIWTDGILPLAMKQGYWLLLDELDFADPAILSLLHPVLEEDPSLLLKENGGELVRPHPNFQIFATANSVGAMNERAGSYSGTNTMNDAFTDRWLVVYVPNLPMAEEIKVIKEKVSGLKNSIVKRIVEFAHKVRNNEITDIEFGDNFSTRRVISWAKKTALLQCPIEGAKIAWLDKMNKSDHDVITRILETHFGVSKKIRNKRIYP